MPHYKRYREFQAKRVNLWWPGTESNRRHKPFQGSGSLNLATLPETQTANKTNLISPILYGI